MTIVELTNYIKLKENEDFYQQIYSSQRHRTFHSVYAKFNIVGGKLTSIDFFMKNYKGEARYGFLNETVNTIYLSDKVLRIGLKLLPVVGVKEVTSKVLGFDINEIENIFVDGVHLKMKASDDTSKLPQRFDNIINECRGNNDGEEENDRGSAHLRFQKLQSQSRNKLKSRAMIENNTDYEHKFILNNKGVGMNCRVSFLITDG